VALNLVIFERLQTWMKQSNLGGSNAGRDIFAGAVAGTVGVVVTFPLDTIKTRMQVSTGKMFFFCLCFSKSFDSRPKERPRQFFRLRERFRLFAASSEA
jgi:hypothetical protein